jgi:hypothetical protein
MASKSWSYIMGKFTNATKNKVETYLKETIVFAHKFEF